MDLIGIVVILLFFYLLGVASRQYSNQRRDYAFLGLRARVDDDEDGVTELWDMACDQ